MRAPSPPVPLMVIVTVAVAEVSLWKVYATTERERVAVETRVTAEQVRLRLEAWIGSRTAAVEHTASHWTVVEDPEQVVAQLVLVGEALEIGHPGHGAVVFHDLADDPRRIETGNAS